LTLKGVEKPYLSTCNLETQQTKVPTKFSNQDPYTIFQVPQQQEVPTNLEKSIKFMIWYQNDYIQSQNDCLQSIDRLKEKMSHLVKTINDRNEKTLPNILLTIPDSPSHIDRN